MMMMMSYLLLCNHCSLVSYVFFILYSPHSIACISIQVSAAVQMFYKNSTIVSEKQKSGSERQQSGRFSQQIKHIITRPSGLSIISQGALHDDEHKSHDASLARVILKYGSRGAVVQCFKVYNSRLGCQLSLFGVERSPQFYQLTKSLLVLVLLLNEKSIMNVGVWPLSLFLPLLFQPQLLLLLLFLLLLS